MERRRPRQAASASRVVVRRNERATASDRWRGRTTQQDSGMHDPPIKSNALSINYIGSSGAGTELVA